MIHIQFICVNFNNSDYTKKLCESLRFQNGFDVDFSVNCSVIDNSTITADSIEMEEYSKKYYWISYNKAPKNLGYFGGLNYGLSLPTSNRYNFIVICNNDLFFDANFCKNLLLNQYKKNTFAICPNVITNDGYHQNPHIFKKIKWSRRLQFDIYFSHYYLARLMSFVLKILRPVKMSPPQPTAGCEIHMGIGACYVLTTEFLKRFSKLNYPHFLYGEEAYFSDQIHSSGGILWFDPDLIVHHAESATLSKIPKRTAYEFSKSGYPSYRKML